MIAPWKARTSPTELGDWNQTVPEKIRELARVRGLSNWDQFQSWIQPRLSQLKDPYLLKGMDTAIQRLLEAHNKQDKVALYGDFDLDGTSALALLKTTFSCLGFNNVVLYQPSRLTEGYGFHAHAVEALQQQGVKVIVTADVGITATIAAQKCQELGVDLIITDHHLPAQELPQALALINPNQGDCPSGLGHLSGVGVAFYLAWALRRKLIQLEKAKESSLELKDLLDCFVIGTLTDMVPLVEENRVLVKHGLHQLTRTRRPGLRYLLNELNLEDRELSSQDVAIRFAPKLNALSRMEKDLRPLDLFLVESEEEAKKLMTEVLAQNDLRVSLQAEAEVLALELAKEFEALPFVFIADKSFHKGIVGLVATRLTQTFQKPSFVGSISEEGIVVGSARAPQGWGGNLVDILGQAALYFHRFGGHANASGFEYAYAQKSEIESALTVAFSKMAEIDKTLEPMLYDIDIEFDQITPQFMNWIDLLGPFGQSFEAPLFRVLHAQILDIKVLRGGHRRLQIESQGKVREALLFSPTEAQVTQLNSTLKDNFLVDLLVEIQWNYFQNRKRVQLLIKEIRPVILSDERALFCESTIES